MMEAGPWAELTDEALVVATLLGCPSAFDELVRRFRPAVCLTARQYAGDADAVEDLCQEAFLRAFLALPRLAGPARFGAWLHAIARNLALRERQNGTRRRARFASMDPLLTEEPADPGPSPAHAFERCEARRVVKEAVEALPLPYREVIALHYWEGMPLSRVATYMGIPLTTAKWRVRYARQRLRRELESLDDRSDREKKA